MSTNRDYREISNAPYHISFAGVDDQTDIEKLMRLGQKWKPYYGILMSPKKKGVPRYPSIPWILDFLDARKELVDRTRNGELPLASTPEVCLHLCGGYIDAMEEDGFVGMEHLLVKYADSITQVQFNLAGREFTEELKKNIRDWARNYGVAPVIQVREFPRDEDFVYLLDGSEGKGVTPATWPDPRFTTASFDTNYRSAIVGYAGGINVNNVFDIANQIQHYDSSYYLDLESGARDSSDRFDPRLVELISEQIYGPRDEFWYEDEIIDGDEPVNLDDIDDDY